MLSKINVYDGARFDLAEHINEFLIRREDARSLEAFLVIVENGKKTHLHKHPEMEQLFFVVSGRGRITTGKRDETLAVEKNDVVYIPVDQLHQIHCESEEALVYLAVNAFLAEAQRTPTSLGHAARVVENYAMKVRQARPLWRRPILIAGSAGFIGRALTSRYLTKRDYVWGLDAKAASGFESFSEHGLLTQRTVDLTDEKEVEKCIRALCKKSGTVPRALVCAAGVTDVHRTFIETTAAMALAQLSANFSTNYNIARAYARTLIDTSRRGTIVFLGSVGATKAHRGQSAYDAAKAAIEGLCRAAAVELAPHGINVNTVAIGPIEDSPSSKGDSRTRKALRELVPIRRYGSLDEACAVLEAIAALDTPYFTGQTVIADGGLTIQLRPGNVERMADQRHPKV